MKISAGHHAVQPLVERAVVLAANHVDLPGHLAGALSDLDAVQLGDPALADALGRFASTWNTALEAFALDTGTLVAILREVDRRYVDVEMATAAAFADAPIGPPADRGPRTRLVMP